MAKKFKAGKCVHCLQWSERLSSDHVLPQGWRPYTTPANLERWQAPSCETCNAQIGKVEDRLLSCLALCLNPDDPASAGIPDKVLRSVDSEAGRTENDSQFRTRKLLRIAGSIHRNSGKRRRTLSLSRNHGAEKVPLNREDLNAVTQKMVRGFFYARNKMYLAEDFEIEPNFSSDIEELIDALPHERLAKSANSEEFQVWYSSPLNPDGINVVRLLIWKHLKLSAFLVPKQRRKQLSRNQNVL